MLAGESFQRDPKQPIDESYTQLIRKYTTAPYLNSPLTDYLPASNTVPNPAKVLGDVAGAPDVLPYAEDVYRYFRLLAAASPRVKVFTIGHSEEGREMIAVAVADEALLAQAQENGARLAQLADPRTLKLDDAKAQALIGKLVPGLLHHRHDPFARNRRAHRVDGTRLPAGGRQRSLRAVHPLAHHHADHAGGGGRWARSHGGHLQMA